MRKEVQHWHMESLSAHNTWLYNTLLYPHHVVSENRKEIQFDGGFEPSRGYFAKKGREKYWIDETVIDYLPLRVDPENCEVLKYKEDIILRPMKAKPFKVVPEHTMAVKTMIDQFVPFTHTEPGQWRLLKFCAIMGMVGRTYICIASKSEFGKSSVYDIMHGLTDKSPVFKPRSIPGVLNQITGDGNIVFDEAHQCKREVRDIMEEFSLQIAGGKSVYINGAMKSSNTRERYPCPLQSITYLYNDMSQYKDPKKDYFEYIFSNNKAIDSRFLKLKLDGKLTEKFGRQFSITGVAEEYRNTYIGYVKEFAWLQQQKVSNTIKKIWETKSVLKLKGRRKMVYDELAWLIDQYAQNQEEYDDIIHDLDTAVIAYREMVEGYNEDRKIKVTEEDIDG